MFSSGSLLPSASGYTGGRSGKQGVETPTLQPTGSVNLARTQKTDFTYYNPTIQSSTKQALQYAAYI